MISQIPDSIAHTEDYTAQWGSHLLQIALWGCNVRHHSAWEWCCGRHTGCGFPCLISVCLLLPILLPRCPTLKFKRLRIHIKSFWSWPWCRRCLGWRPPKTKKCRWSTENQLCKMRQKITDENSPSYFHSRLPHLQRPLRRLRQPLRHPLHHPPEVWWVTYTIPTPITKGKIWQSATCPPISNLWTPNTQPFCFWGFSWSFKSLNGRHFLTLPGSQCHLRIVVGSQDVGHCCGHPSSRTIGRLVTLLVNRGRPFVAHLQSSSGFSSQDVQALEQGRL